ncbi:MAG TPA: hypothetical protein PK131_01975 [Candidatus Woesebacteria bacterium]|nr:hypothetical protein [Candidatus Woesebacteria bacterium]HRT40282.1 hypothetical protein [Candidatus Woesebacteria bacterium]
MKSKKYLLSFVFLGILGIWLLKFPKQSFSQRFQSNSYVIEWGNFNMTGGTKTSTNYRLSDTVGQMAPGESNSNAYNLEAGFQYIYNTFNKFRFTINDPDLAINFGSLSPGVGITSSHSITISCPAGHGYQIMAEYNHPLQDLSSGITIPDTKCDLGSTCTPTNANTWITNTSYGFGYNVAGVGATQYFPNITQFRPFTNTPVDIMTETTPVQNHTATVTYKVLISSLQSAGNYENAITFIAVPNY